MALLLNALSVDVQQCISLTTETGVVTGTGLNSKNTSTSTSTTFFPDWNKVQTDLVFRSSNSVLFYAHKHLIRQICDNAFNTLISSSSSTSTSLGLMDDSECYDHENQIIQVPERSETLDIILHALYNLSPISSSPSFDLLHDSINVMPKYDITPNLILVPNTPIYDLLVSHLSTTTGTPESTITTTSFDYVSSSSPSSSSRSSLSPLSTPSLTPPSTPPTSTPPTSTSTPTTTLSTSISNSTNYIFNSTAFRLYTLSATHNIFTLAQISSSYLLSLDVHQISDSMASLMGSLYFMKLMRLHMNRIEALKSILSQPPNSHQPVTINIEGDGGERGGCQDEIEQKGLTKAWSFVTTCLVWDAKPDLSIDKIEMAYGSLANNLTCGLCIEMLKKRIEEVIDQWSSVKRTI